MRVLIVERNLMWSARLAKSVAACGHEPTVVTTHVMGYDAVILNLVDGIDAQAVAALQSGGSVVIAHAGHKEKDLHELGQIAGCDILATNGELTHKLPKILERAGTLLLARRS